MDFAERDKCKPVTLGLSLAGNLEDSMSLYGTEWRERGYGLEVKCSSKTRKRRQRSAATSAG